MVGAGFQQLLPAARAVPVHGRGTVVPWGGWRSVWGWGTALGVGLGCPTGEGARSVSSQNSCSRGFEGSPACGDAFGSAEVARC